MNTYNHRHIALNPRKGQKRLAAVHHLSELIAAGFVAYPVGKRPKHLDPECLTIGVITPSETDALLVIKAANIAASLKLKLQGENPDA